MSGEIVIRRATVADAPAIASVNIETWRAVFRGIVPDAFLASLDLGKRTASITRRFSSEGYAAFVCTDELGCVIGYADVGPPREQPFPCHAELYSLYVLPAYHRRGCGRRLFGSCISVLPRDVESVLILALEANPYREFYEHIGCVRVCISNIDLAGKPFPEIAYRYQR